MAANSYSCTITDLEAAALKNLLESRGWEFTEYHEALVGVADLGQQIHQRAVGGGVKIGSPRKDQGPVIEGHAVGRTASVPLHEAPTEGAAGRGLSPSRGQIDSIGQGLPSPEG